MEFSLKNTSGRSIVDLMRRAGYHYQKKDEERNQLAFVRSLQGSSFPRFHIYLKENKDTGDVRFNLHLDQKRPIYKGAAAHSGDYEGGPVEEEVDRLKKKLKMEMN